MKKIIFALLIVGSAQMASAQFINKLKDKVKTAATTSSERQTNKVVDKAVNKPADSLTNKALNEADKKVKNLFKRHNKTPKPTQTNTDSTKLENQ